MDDKAYMKRALKLAARARGRTSPNPMVGAVIVKRDNIIGEGYHKMAGTPHAEAVALDDAEGRGGSSGATLYVTLEPCCHTEKRTPPCTRAIMDSGIRRIVIAMEDPNPKVSGRGITELDEAGVEVQIGLLEDEARELNEAYIKYITTGRPFVTLKTAVTLDGKTATPTGESKWITGEKARKLVHNARGRSDAVITAIGTVLADNPRLTARIRGGRDPLRVVIDPELKAPLDAEIVKTPPGTIIVTAADNKKSRTYEEKGVKVLRYEGRLDMRWLMQRLGSMGIMTALIEGGASLNSYALHDGVVDRVMFFVAPKMIGGKDSFPSIGGGSFRKLEDAFRVEGMTAKMVGDDLLIEGRVRDPLL